MSRRRSQEFWTDTQLIRLQSYADRGFTMREAAQCLNRSYRSVRGMAQLKAIKFHGPMGAPKGNHNRHLGEMRKEMRRVVEEIDRRYGNSVQPAEGNKPGKRLSHNERHTQVVSPGEGLKHPGVASQTSG